MTSELKPCPCGKVPENLIAYPDLRIGTCHLSCAHKYKWFVFVEPKAQESFDLALLRAWNAAPRPDDELARQALGFAYAYCATWESEGRRVGEMEFPLLADAWEKANA